MLSVNFLLVGMVAVVLVLYLLRRRTRIVTAKVSVSTGGDTESAGAQQSS